MIRQRADAGETSFFDSGRLSPAERNGGHRGKSQTGGNESSHQGKIAHLDRRAKRYPPFRPRRLEMSPECRTPLKNDEATIGQRPEPNRPIPGSEGIPGRQQLHFGIQDRLEVDPWRSGPVFGDDQGDVDLPGPETIEQSGPRTFENPNVEPREFTEQLRQSPGQGLSPEGISGSDPEGTGTGQGKPRRKVQFLQPPKQGLGFRQQSGSLRRQAHSPSPAMEQLDLPGPLESGKPGTDAGLRAAQLCRRAAHRPGSRYRYERLQRGHVGPWGGKVVSITD